MSKTIMTYAYTFLVAAVCGLAIGQQVQPSPAPVPGKDVNPVPETQIKNTSVTDEKLREMVERSFFLPRTRAKKPEVKQEEKKPEEKKEPPPPVIYTITGVFRMPDGKHQLLVEKNGGGESAWISAGSEFKGVKVLEIALEGTKVISQGAEKTLHVGDEFFKEMPPGESVVPKQPENSQLQQPAVSTQNSTEQKVETAHPPQKPGKNDKVEKKPKKKMKFIEED